MVGKIRPIAFARQAHNSHFRLGENRSKHGMQVWGESRCVLLEIAAAMKDCCNPQNKADQMLKKLRPSFPPERVAGNGSSRQYEKETPGGAGVVSRFCGIATAQRPLATRSAPGSGPQGSPTIIVMHPKVAAAKWDSCIII